MKHTLAIDKVKKFFYKLYLSYIPNKYDKFKQKIIKILFLISLITFIASASYITGYIISCKRQDRIIDDSRKIWHETSSAETGQSRKYAKELLLKENGDFKGWITIPDTKIDNPFYQTVDNEFYLTHNQKKQKSAYGALFLDCKNVITETEKDSNLVIYGHHMKNGSMFSGLTKYKTLNFYKTNPTIEFSTLYSDDTYKIYAAFVLNASKDDDNGYFYDIFKKSFLDDSDFDLWKNEALQRSLINTGVDVRLGDDIITLVTCTYDFDNARFVVMARKTRDGEDTAVDTSSAVANPKPRYPKRWYDDRGLEYPFN